MEKIHLDKVVVVAQLIKELEKEETGDTGEVVEVPQMARGTGQRVY